MNNVTKPRAPLTQIRADASRFVLDQARGTFQLLALAPPERARLREIRRARRMASLLAGLTSSASEAREALRPAAPDWDWQAAEFLRELMGALRPTLQTVLRSRHIVLSRATLPVIALRSDGMFVRIDRAGQEDTLDPVQICRTYPDLTRVLDAISAEFAAVEQGVEIHAAVVLLNQCRAALSAGLPRRTAAV